MTKKFEVGDKVRDVMLNRGATGVVIEVRNAVWPVRVKYDHNGKTAAYHLDELELVVEEKRKFAIGNKVRVTDTHYSNSLWRLAPKNGDVGVVTGYATGEEPSVEYSVVRFDGNAEPTNSIGDDGWRFAGDAIELIAPAAPSPKFNVGDRVKVGETTHGSEGTIVARLDQYVVRPFLVMFDDCWLRRYDEDEMKHVIAPRSWSKPDASKSVGLDVLDPLVDEMTTALRAHGGDCETRRFGDAMVVVENGQAKIYRLEASAVVE